LRRTKRTSPICFSGKIEIEVNDTENRLEWPLDKP
jgi:hypothetical protein